MRYFVRLNDNQDNGDHRQGSPNQVTPLASLTICACHCSALTIKSIPWGLCWFENLILKSRRVTEQIRMSPFCFRGSDDPICGCCGAAGMPDEIANINVYGRFGEWNR